jgi:hypothetical protein
LLSSFGSLSAQCIEGDCENGRGALVYPDGGRYFGTFQSGQPHGEGIRIYADGRRYTGRLQRGLPDGVGAMLTPDGTTRRGRWRAGVWIGPAPDRDVSVASPVAGLTGCVDGDCQDGRGVYVLPDGAVYTGTFRDGEIHGTGVCLYPDGSRYSGSWDQRLPHGRGTKTWPDGREASGLWIRGVLRETTGRRSTLAERSVTAYDAGFAPQSGCLRGDCVQGNGRYAYPDGSSYRGEFQDQLPHGFGIFHYANGDRYEGEFTRGLRDGQGTLISRDQRRLSGYWRAGEFLSAEEPLGCIRGDCEDEVSVFVYRGGDRYIGAFAQGQPNGRGQLLYANGSRYEGQFRDGVFHGQGAFFEQSGRIFRGEWEAGTFVGASAPTAPPDRPVASPAPEPARPAAPKVWALIIGIATYPHMPALRYPDDDAYRLFSFLKSPAGGAVPDAQIKLLVDEAATEAAIRTEARRLFQRAGPNDLVLLYFSGHGLPGAFLPIDYDGYTHEIRHAELRELLAASPARHKVCVADACHSGSLLAERGKQPGLLQRYYEQLAQAEPGTALIMSSKAEETSLESSGLRQGVFSHFLIRGAKGEADVDANGLVTIRELFEFVQRNVSDYTGQQQNPVIEGDFDPEMVFSVVE